MFAAPKPAVNGLVNAASKAVEATPLATPNMAACAVLIRPVGSGRFFVRTISASYSCSIVWLKVFAEHAARLVPTVTAARAGQAIGAPAKRNPPVVVATTSLRVGRQW